jgi:hypothetical protein
VGDVGGGVGENTIDELTDDLSVDYGVDLETATEDPATQTADPVLRGAQLWVGGLGGTCVHEMKPKHDQTFHHVVPATLTTDTKGERERGQRIIATLTILYTEKERAPHLCSTVLSTDLPRSGHSPDTAVHVQSH